MSEFESKVEADLILPKEIVNFIKEIEKKGCTKHLIQLEKMGDIYTAGIKSGTKDHTITNIVTLAIRSIQDGKINP